MILKTLRKVQAKGNYETAHRLRAGIGSIFRYEVASGGLRTQPLQNRAGSPPRPLAQHAVSGDSHPRLDPLV